MKTNIKRSYENVIQVFGMVQGFNTMLAASTIIRTVYRLCGVFFAIDLALLVSYTFSGKTIGFAFYLGLFTLLFAIPCLSYADTYVSHDVSFKIVKELQTKVYDHMDKIAPGGLNGINTADAATLILSDINVFEWFVAHCLVEWAGTFITLLVCLLLLLRESVVAAIVVFLLLMIMLMTPLIFSRKANDKGLIMKQLYGELNGIIADGVAGHKDIVAFHDIDAFFSRLSMSAQRFSSAKEHYAVRGEAEKTIEAVLAGIAILAGVLISARNLEAGNYLVLIPIFALCSSTVICIQSSLSEGTNFGFVFGAASRILSILALSPTVEDKGDKNISSVVTDKDDLRLELKNVCFGYENEPLLKGVSFNACAPEMICLVSSSGGGKSTISKLLQRFWDVQNGEICINGVDIREIDIASLREIVMVIPQETYLFHDSIRSNLLLAKPDASDEEMSIALSNSMASSFVNKLPEGAETIIDENGSSLSGGERQRIALAQAFLKNPPVLVLDESTSALDAENEQHIMQSFKNQRSKKITIVITHRISSMQMSDKIIFMNHGKVSAIGTYGELMELNSEFRNLVKGELSEET